MLSESDLRAIHATKAGNVIANAMASLSRRYGEASVNELLRPYHQAMAALERERNRISTVPLEDIEGVISRVREGMAWVEKKIHQAHQASVEKIFSDKKTSKTGPKEGFTTQKSFSRAEKKISDEKKPSGPQNPREDSRHYRYPVCGRCDAQYWLVWSDRPKDPLSPMCGEAGASVFAINTCPQGKWKRRPYVGPLHDQSKQQPAARKGAGA